MIWPRHAGEDAGTYRGCAHSWCPLGDTRASGCGSPGSQLKPLRAAARREALPARRPHFLPPAPERATREVRQTGARWISSGPDPPRQLAHDGASVLGLIGAGAGAALAPPTHRTSVRWPCRSGSAPACTPGWSCGSPGRVGPLRHAQQPDRRPGPDRVGGPRRGATRRCPTGRARTVAAGGPDDLKGAVARALAWTFGCALLGFSWDPGLPGPERPGSPAREHHGVCTTSTRPHVLPQRVGARSPARLPCPPAGWRGCERPAPDVGGLATANRRGRAASAQ